MSKKISELEECKKLNEESSLPILCDGETMQLLYKTLVEDLRKVLNFSNFSGDYNDLSNKPDLSTFVTESDLNDKLGEIDTLLTNIVVESEAI